MTTASRIRRLGAWLTLPLAGVAAACAGGAGWPREQAFMAALIVGAAVLWLTEALPLFATSCLIITAEVVFLANPGGWSSVGFAAGNGPTFKAVIAAIADPTLLLFFAGFVMGRAATKEGVDATVAAWVLRPFAGNRSLLLFAIMGVTALFGMWMSNTAIATLMLALVAPLIAQLPGDAPYRRALLLAVPFAANISGLSTPIATPPNAIAVGLLARDGHQVGFLDWMAIGIPLTLVMLALTGGLLLAFFRGGAGPVGFVLAAPPLRPRALRVMAIFAGTVLLWLSEAWHGLPAPAVALFPVVALLAIGVIVREDINSIEWDVLLLIAGGLALGYGMQVTQVDTRIVAFLPTGESQVPLLLVSLVALTLALGTFLSNTAVANLLLPVGLAAVPAQAQVHAALAIVLTASLSMALPISTPPNAIAFSRGNLSVADMAKVGVLVGLAGGLIVAAGVVFF